jgi:hypothetical protein
MRIKLKEPVNADIVSTDEFLKAIDGNRARIRTVAGLILSTCGMLLSGSFVILFFVLKERSISVPSLVPVTLFATTACLLIAVILSVASAFPPRPIDVYTKIEMADTLLSLYRSEYRIAAASGIFLVSGALLLVGALGIFGWSTLFWQTFPG